MRKIISVVTLFFFLASGLVLRVPIVSSASFTGGSLSLSDSRPSTASTGYTLDFDNVTSGAIKCILVKLDTAATGLGGVPTGLDSTSVTLGGTSDFIPTPASWAVDDSTNGTLEITYATGGTPASATDRTIILNGITNGSVVETAYFAVVSTYNNTDCATSPVDSGVVSFIYTAGQAVNTTVDPSLSFAVDDVASSQTVNGATTNRASTVTTVPLGTVTASTNSIAAHDLIIGTNASNGYSIFARYTAALTNGSSDTITDHTGSNAAPTAFPAAGTEAFAYTTNDATLGTGTADRFTSSGANKWAAFTTSNAEVAYNAGVASETTRIGYQVGIASTTEAGTYQNTVILTATPTY
jgi:hypothetical protein